MKSCALHGVAPEWNLLVGFPGESEDVYRRYVELIPLLTHLHPPSGAYPVRFDRFSPYYYQADKYELNLRPLDFYHLIYPFGEEDLSNFAYYFMDQNTEDTEPQYFVAMVEWIDKLRAKVGQWRALWRDPQNHPNLFLHEDGVVYDSRSGSVVEHHIGAAGRAILRHLDRPTRIAELSKVFSPEVNVVEEIERLDERGLLFREEDRLFSLVLDTDHEEGAVLAAVDRIAFADSK